MAKQQQQSEKDSTISKRKTTNNNNNNLQEGSSSNINQHNQNEHHHDHSESDKNKSERTFLNLVKGALGIYLFFILYGLGHEKIVKGNFGGEKWAFPLFLVFGQCVGNCIVSLFALLTNKKEAKINVLHHSKMYFLCACSYIGAMVSSNYALEYINYPTQILAKSCKMIPVMIAGIFFLRRKYALREYITVFCITMGISIFTMKNLSFLSSSSSMDFSSDSLLGLFLITISLGLDGFTGTYEEKILMQYKPSSMLLMFKINFWAALLLLAGLIPTGQFIQAIQFCISHVEIIPYLFCAAVCSGFGQIYIFYTLRVFGALVTSTVTTTRKFFTILFSVVFYGHSLTSLQWFGVVFVFGGLSFDIYYKYFSKSKHGGHGHGGHGHGHSSHSNSTESSEKKD